MALDAVIFDVDGTLLDTNHLHACAWKEAINEVGYNVGQDRIIIEIGKGGDRVAPAVLGEEGAEKHGAGIRERAGELYRAYVEREHIAIFPRVRELFEAIHQRGLKIAVATASKQDDLEKVLLKTGLDLMDLADEVVTDSDVERSKPAPDVVTAAAGKLKLSPAQCAMVGDTPYDIQAAQRGGVVCIGVLTGVHSRETMLRTGARAVYRDTGDLLDHLDEALERCSPGAIHLTQDTLERLMGEALAGAQKAMEQREIPAGAVIVAGDGMVLARGHSEIRQRHTATAHAELIALGGLPDLKPAQRRGLILVTTVEPCVMCFGAAMEAGIDTIIYGLPAPSSSGISRCEPTGASGAYMPRTVGDVCLDDSRALLREWLAQFPDDVIARNLLGQG